MKQPLEEWAQHIEKDDTPLWSAGNDVAYKNAVRKQQRFCKFCSRNYDRQTDTWKKVCGRLSFADDAGWVECTCQCLGEPD